MKFFSAAGAALLVTLVAAGAAEAATVSVETTASGGREVVYRAAPGETNRVRATVADGNRAAIFDDGAALTAGSGCTTTSGGQPIRCEPAGTPRFELGDGDDVMSADVGLVFGGEGSDVVTAAQQLQDRYPEVFAHVVFDGGPGADSLRDGEGALAQMSYASAASGVTVSVDGVANDGVPGENDNVDPSVRHILGSPFDDVIHGHALSSSTLDGGAGDDTIIGGAGNDLLIGGAGADNLTGGPAWDRIWGGDVEQRDETARTVADGGAGEDSIVGGAGPDSLSGGPDDDSLSGEGGDDDLDGGDGDDSLRPVDGVDSMTGGPGRDTVSCDIYPAGIRIRLDGQLAASRIGQGADTIAADVEDADCALVPGADIVGNDGPNILRGVGTIDGRGGGDVLGALTPFQSTGTSTLIGGSGSDLLIALTQAVRADALDGEHDFITCLEESFANGSRFDAIDKLSGCGPTASLPRRVRVRDDRRMLTSARCASDAGIECRMNVTLVLTRGSSRERWARTTITVPSGTRRRVTLKLSARNFRRIVRAQNATLQVEVRPSSVPPTRNTTKTPIELLAPRR